MSGFPVDGSNYTVNSLNTMARTANINSLTCSSNCTILTNGYFLSVSNINVNSGNTLILDNSGGGGVASSFILNSGNLQLNLANDLPCNITNNGNLIFNVLYKDCIYYGSLSGSGTFKKTGAYNLTITNNNTISGAIEIDSGTMTVNGTLLNSTITVDSSANLSGFGSVGNVIITNNGTISSSANTNGLTIKSVQNLQLSAGTGTLIENNLINTYVIKNDISFNSTLLTTISNIPFNKCSRIEIIFNNYYIGNNILQLSFDGTYGTNYKGHRRFQTSAQQNGGGNVSCQYLDYASIPSFILDNNNGTMTGMLELSLFSNNINKHLQIPGFCF